MWQWQLLLRDRVTDYKEITGATVRITEAITVVGRIDGIMDDSCKETIHRVRIPILTELDRPLHALCATLSKRVAYHSHT